MGEFSILFSVHEVSSTRVTLSMSLMGEKAQKGGVPVQDDPVIQDGVIQRGERGVGLGRYLIPAFPGGAERGIQSELSTVWSRQAESSQGWGGRG